MGGEYGATSAVAGRQRSTRLLAVLCHGHVIVLQFGTRQTRSGKRENGKPQADYGLHIFLANGLGETWRSASKEAAAGVVLIALAKNAELKNFLNSNGWKLVVSFVRSNPYIAKNLSPRTMDEIFTYQQAIRAPMLATC